MKYLVFDTPGLLDKRAFSLIGVSAKPSVDNPIGRFGTGLKYSIACLVRWSGEVAIWIGDDRYTFSKLKGTFRGTDYNSITLRRDRFGITGRNTRLPFPDTYGRDWKPWQVMRELEANTADENGDSYIVDTPPLGIVGRTLIVVTDPTVIAAYEDRDTVFLPRGYRQGDGVQVFDKPSKYIYWRSMRVLELQRPALLTYNILDNMSITEDRTLTSEWEARVKIARWLTAQADAAYVRKVITAKQGDWEHEMDLETYSTPSDAFRETMVLYPKGASVASTRYWSRHDHRVTTIDVFEAHPLPWRMQGNAVVDLKGRTVFDAPFGYAGKWSLVGQQLINEIHKSKNIALNLFEQEKKESIF
jgi:hypothetical protein